MGYIGGSPNISNLTATVNIPPGTDLVPFTHENANPEKERQWRVPSTGVQKNIPAGYYYCYISNTSLNDLQVIINGQTNTVKPGETFKSEDRLDWQHKKQELGPAIAFNNNTGEDITVHIRYPNDSAVNPYTI